MSEFLLPKYERNEQFYSFFKSQVVGNDNLCDAVTMHLIRETMVIVLHGTNFYFLPLNMDF